MTNYAAFAQTAQAVIERAHREHRESREALEQLRAAPSLISHPFYVVTNLMHRVGPVDGLPATLGTEVRPDVTPHLFTREQAERVAEFAHFKRQGARLMTRHQFHEARLESTDATMEQFQLYLDGLRNGDGLQL